MPESTERSAQRLGDGSKTSSGTIFISYAREDREAASLVATTFATAGWSVWWDRDLRAGRAFDRVIEEAISAAAVVVVLWSRFSVTSDWVRAEAGFALDADKLLPVTLDEATVPLRFRHVQTLSLAGWDGWSADAPVLRRLCSEIAERLGTPERGRTTHQVQNPLSTNDSHPELGEASGNRPKTASPQAGSLRQAERHKRAGVPKRVLAVGTLLVTIIVVCVVWAGDKYFEFNAAYALYDINISDSIHGLSTGSQVEYNGIPVGRVIDIAINPTDVQLIRVTIEMKAGVIVKEDAVAVLNYNPANDTARIEIRRGTPDALALTAKPGERYPVIRFSPNASAKPQSQ
jgi:hypothetical protein